MGAIKPKGLNRIAKIGYGVNRIDKIGNGVNRIDKIGYGVNRIDKIGYGHLCLRKENLGLFIFGVEKKHITKIQPTG